MFASEQEREGEREGGKEGWRERGRDRKRERERTIKAKRTIGGNHTYGDMKE
jgi:hypothetical protein